MTPTTTNKRRRSTDVTERASSPAKRARTIHPDDRLSVLSDEIILRILGFLPLKALSRCRGVSKRLGRLAGDGQVWKGLFVKRFGGSGTASLAKGWRERYRLRDNWARGVCVVRGLEGRGDDGDGGDPEDGSGMDMLVRLINGWVVDVEANRLRIRALRGDSESSILLDGKATCLAVDEADMKISIGFEDGGWGIWQLDDGGAFIIRYRHPKSSHGSLSQIAIGEGYAITMSATMILSLYTLSPPTDTMKLTTHTDDDEIEPRLLSSLHSHTTWPPLTLAIRKSKDSLIASIAYSYPTYLSGWSVGIQELHLSSTTQEVSSSRLATSIPQNFHPLLPLPDATTDGRDVAAVEKQPSALTYQHPYLLASYGDNTMSLYMVRSTEGGLWVGKGERLWGCTSGVRGVELGGRGKAVSICEGGEVRVWELERGLGRFGRKRGGEVDCVRVRTRGEESDSSFSSIEDGEGFASVGFDEEVVVVGGGEGVRVYDFV